ncbi:MAG: tRNA (guanine(10)-N(2))-dimethyltransferase [Halobacteriota archaeon]
MRTRLALEGQTSVLVPRLDPNASYPPSSAPVFYNPRMELSRDISVACIQAFADNQRDDSGLTYLDALAGCGIRGFRVANEAQVEVTVNDYNLAAYELIKRNAKRFQQNVHVEHRDANALMSEARFNVIDVDPFGSPAPFVDAACRSASKMLCVTATDTAPLSGAHFSAGVRRYSALPMNTEYHAETGIRILIGTIIRELVKYDKSATPVLAHATEHYYRAYLLLDRGVELANACVRSMGFIAHCFACGNRYVLSGLFPTLRSDCAFCGAKVAAAGPLWLGTLHDQKFCLQVLENLETGVFGTKMRAAKIITRCLNELDTVTFFDYHKLLRELKCPPVPIETLVTGLRTVGCRASRTHFSGTSIKTDADADMVKRVLLDLSCESEKARLNHG